MGKWNFLYELGDNKRVYGCSKCGSTITVDSELIGKMSGEKFCYNCGEMMDGESIEKNRARAVDLIKILDHYGRKAQRRQAVEELSELIQAICKDVIVMIEQLKIMVGERDRTRIENIIDEKISRQLERIKHERTGKNG